MMTNVPYPNFVGVIVNGVTFFALPSMWVKTEDMNTSNDVQQNISPQYAPAIVFSGTSYQVRIEIPYGHFLVNAALRTLKSMFKLSSETLASQGEEYENIDYTEEIDPSEVGRIISPWRKRDDPIIDSTAPDITEKQSDLNTNPTPFNDYMTDGRRAAITAYMGISHQCMGGYIRGFRSNLRVSDMMEEWNFSLDAINISVLRKGPPDAPEKPEVPTDTPPSGYRPSHGIQPKMLTPP